MKHNYIDPRHGKLVERSELEQIANHFIISAHAKYRILERGKDLGDLKTILLNPSLAYYNTDGSINLGIDDYRYFVIIPKAHSYLILTLKETIQEPRTTIYERRELAKKGKKRKHEKRIKDK